MLRIYLFALLTLTRFSSAETRTLWQVLHDYRTIIAPSNENRQARHEVNPFISYTNIGTDYGYIGPAVNTIGWKRSMISMEFNEDLDSWGGVWHSMSRLDRMHAHRMNFHACYPEQILPAFQPKITGIKAIIRGKGKWKIDLLDQYNKLLWSETREISADRFAEIIYDLPSEGLESVKHLSWVAERGADIDLDAIELRVTTPDVSFEEWVFLASYMKALTCWSSETGLLRDRAHIPDGAFDSISASGLFCAATAAAASRGIVEKDFAKVVCQRAFESASSLRGPYGLLPHFVKMDEGMLKRHKGTEYSTIDTALFYFGLLIATHTLDELTMHEQVLEWMKEMDFAPLINEQGFISHGVEKDGKTIIPYYWRDWGGESALVILLQAIAQPELKSTMASTGSIHQGTGFIIELQSLLFPDFSKDEADVLTGVNWLTQRRAHLTKQMTHEVTSQAQGLFGLSAGEGADGNSYHVGGTDLPEQKLLHPHYALMAAQVHEDPVVMAKILRNFEQQAAFTPWGMVENISLPSNEKLPMIGGLNASFEALGAYHFLCRSTGTANVVYDSSQAIPQFREAMKIFYR